MSTKATLLLSAENEHWYHDCSDDSFVIEFDGKHFDGVVDSEGAALIVKKGTALHRAIVTDIYNGKVCAKCGLWSGWEKCSCGSTRFYHESIGPCSDDSEENQDSKQQLNETL